jgi:putative Mn2+ efflux pump MntP
VIIVISAAAFIVGGVIAAMVVPAIIRARNERRRKAKERDKAKRKPPEFSKLILMLVMATYFIAVGVGVRLSFIDYMQYSTLAMLVGAPTAVAIGFYAWKAKSENVLKYKKENKKETEGIPFDPGNIT